MFGLKEFFEQLKAFFVQIGQFLKKFLRPYRAPLAVFAIVGFAIFAALPWYAQWKTTHVTLLTGPEGGAGQTQARRIQKLVGANSSSWLPDYQLHVEKTEGLQEVRQLISEDSIGAFVGFAHDGFPISENVRVLIPLDNDYLHIICRQEFYKEHSSIPQNIPRTFHSISKRLKPGRVFLGPQQSGTRQVAKLVMDHYQLDCDELHSNGIADFNEMRSALNNGSIDVAFYCGPITSDVIKKIASEKKCVLLGLNAHRDAIGRLSPHVFAAQFEEQAYRYGEFCPKPLDTIAARRVLICSSNMSSWAAYDMASYASAALRPVVGDIGWKYWRAGLPDNADVNYDLHPGGKQFLLGNPSMFASWGSNVFVLSFLLWVAVEILRAISKALSRATHGQEVVEETLPSNVDNAAMAAVEFKTPPNGLAAPAAAVAVAVPHEAFASLEREIYVQLFEDFLELPAVPTRSQRAAWSKHIAQIHERVLHEYQQGRISERDSESFFAAIDKVNDAISRRQPTDGQQKKTLRKKG